MTVVRHSLRGAEVRRDAGYAVERLNARQRSLNGLDELRFVGGPFAADKDQFNRNHRNVQLVLKDSPRLHRLEVFVCESAGLQEFAGARGEWQDRKHKDGPGDDDRVSRR